MTDGQGQSEPAPHGIHESEARYQANQLAKADRQIADLLFQLRADGMSWIETLNELRRHQLQG